jgi:hypothetical protein
MDRRAQPPVSPARSLFRSKGTSVLPLQRRIL